MKLHRSARTDVGQTRDHNEDTYGISDEAAAMGDLLVVCDGMGGHAAGEVASQLAVDAILASYYADPDENRPEALKRAFASANTKVYTQGRGNMGTTGVAALLHHDALHIANVGDSRAYLIRNGEIRQVSRDHSFVSDQVAAGLITAEQARTSQHKNIITRALGYQPEVTVDLFRLPLQVGDVVLLSSDGLHGLVNDDELAQIALAAPLEEAVDRMVDLANERGGTDNITVVMARVDALDWDAHPVDDAPDDLASAPPLDGDNPRATQQITDRIVPASSPPPASTPAPAPAPAPAAERRLTLLGGLLATLLLVTLLAVILLVYRQPLLNVASPGAVATPPAASAIARPTAAPATPATPATPTAAAATAAPATPATPTAPTAVP